MTFQCLLKLLNCTWISGGQLKSKSGCVLVSNIYAKLRFLNCKISPFHAIFIYFMRGYVGIYWSVVREASSRFTSSWTECFYSCTWSQRDFDLLWLEGSVCLFSILWWCSCLSVNWLGPCYRVFFFVCVCMCVRACCYSLLYAQLFACVSTTDSAATSSEMGHW